MALAVLILAHKNAHQVSRLFRSVYHADDLFILHFDSRADSSLHELGEDLAHDHDNVLVLRSRPISWGGFEMVAVQLEAMAAALKSERPWHHFVNLTGQDFPIKTREHIVARLGKAPESNYVSWFDPVMTPLWSNARERLERYYLDWPWLDRLLGRRFVNRPIRKTLGWINQLPHLPGYRRSWPTFFRYIGGSNHVILSRTACSYMTRSPDARRIFQWLRHSANPDEIAFQSVLLNGPLADTVVNTNLREIDFPAHAPHPRTFTSEDFDLLLRSDRLYARKFDESKDTEILDLIEEHLSVMQLIEGNSSVLS